MELTQVRFLVGDFGAAFRFYRDVLGLVPQVDDDRGPYGKLSLPGGTAAIALQSRESAEAMVGAIGGQGEACIVAIRVADVTSVVRDVAARGGVFLREPHVVFGRMRVAHLRDPEGNLIELQEWLEARAEHR